MRCRWILISLLSATLAVAASAPGQAAGPRPAGTLSVTATGLPEGVAPRITLTPGAPVTGPTARISPGRYRVRAAAVKRGGLVYEPVRAVKPVRVRAGRKAVLTFRYRVPAPPVPSGGEVIPGTLFGLHDAGGSAPRLDAVRLWDSGVRWDQVHTAPGVFDWSRLDREVDSARARGAGEVLYVLGSTPQWAASAVSDSYYYGGGTASPPKDPAVFAEWARQVALRYKGRITAYQIWNEANLKAFYAGDVATLSRMTTMAAAAIREVDPAAKIVTASSTLRTTTWLKNYLQAVRSTGVRVDAVGVHLYPWLSEGPGNGTVDHRRSNIWAVQRVLSEVGLSAPVWDTEINFGNRRDNGWPKRVLDTPTGTTYVARSYLDSLRYGVSQVYWYGWDHHVLGIDLTDPASGQVTPTGQAFHRLRDWLVGARWVGCEDRRRTTTCTIVRGDRAQALVYSRSAAAQDRTVPLGHYRKVCPLAGPCLRAVETPVGPTPVLFR